MVDETRVYRAKRDFSKEMWIGAQNPLVKVVGFFDHECPYCGKWFRTMSGIVRAHPADVRLVLLLHPMAYHKGGMRAAMAAMEVFKQTGNTPRFWAFQNHLLDNRQHLTVENLVRWAVGKGGADGGRVRAAITSNRHLSKLRERMSWGARLGIHGIPGYFINGRFMSGALPYDRIHGAVLRELRHARQVLRSGVERRHVYEHIVGKGLHQAAWVMKRVKNYRRKYRRLSTTTRFSLPSAGLPFMGDPDAEVVLTLAYDAECRFTNNLLDILFPLLNGDKTAPNGFPRGLKIVFLHYPLPFHKKAVAFHQALQEVYLQKGPHGVKRLVKLFRRAYEGGTDSFRTDLIPGFARSAGCDMRRFAQAMRSGKHKRFITATRNKAHALGVRGTPTVFINGRVIRKRALPLYRDLVTRAHSEAVSFLKDHPTVKRAQYYGALMRSASTVPVWE